MFESSSPLRLRCVCVCDGATIKRKGKRKKKRRLIEKKESKGKNNKSGGRCKGVVESCMSRMPQRRPESSESTLSRSSSK